MKRITKKKLCLLVVLTLCVVPMLNFAYNGDHREVYIYVTQISAKTQNINGVSGYVEIDVTNYSNSARAVYGVLYKDNAIFADTEFKDIYVRAGNYGTSR